MKLTGKEAREVVWDESDDWEQVTEDSIIESARWSILKSAVFKHEPSGKFYEFTWSIGSTECQDEKPYENDDFVEPNEVEQVEVTVKQWRKVKNENTRTN